MSFQSWIFIGIFLPVSLLGYHFINKTLSKKLSVYFLILCNFIFYGYAGIEHLIYLLACICVNYVLGNQLIKKQNKGVLIVGLGFNIGALLFLKYTNFLIESLNPLIGTDFNLIHVFLPLGLSFFTFQFVALLYDCYRGKITELPFVKYVLYTSFFPKIIQGPIMLFQTFAEQIDLDHAEPLKEENVAKGLYAFILGLSKKMLIADVLAKFVNAGFSGEHTSYGSIALIFLLLAYTLQIYFDFSGYTDMARGIGLMLNFDLPRNFNSPYKAKSINDFWKRWHMSLTSFFTKYLYIPLGGNRKGQTRAYLNSMIVFFVSGLWHGANYTFIVWGLLHGLLSVAEKKWKYTDKLPLVIQWIYTFVLINITWLFFRANSLTQVGEILQVIFNFNLSMDGMSAMALMILPEIEMAVQIVHGTALLKYIPILFLMILVICVCFCRNTEEKLEVFKPTFIKAGAMVILLSWCLLSIGEKITFIYEMF